KIRSQAAGSNFRQWLLPQIERPDRVGDIARDVEDDPGFPQEINRYEELEDYLLLKGACEAAIDSSKEAWLEYIQQYPERVKPCAFCDECGTSIDLDEAFVVWNPHSSLMVLDSDCLDNLNNDFDGIKSWNLRDVNKVDVTNFLDANIKCFDKKGIFVLWQWEMLEEKLKLWGVNPPPPIEKSGCVYFIQSQGTHTIKIGYTSGQAQNRLKDLQTAHPYQLNILATLPGDRNYEKSLHQRFAEYRLKGEWFEPHPDLLAFIALLNKNET
ncbi:MAG: YozE family protein, partial [Snowella sp.]|nr:YozE family protein [Snowella sp.]